MRMASNKRGVPPPTIKVVLAGAAFLLAVLTAPLLIVGSEEADPESVAGRPRVATVKVETVGVGLLTMWQVSEGVAQARRKEFLQFEQPGVVAFIGEDESGQELREGSRVFGAADGGRLGQLIARLDHRGDTARGAHADAEIAAARRRVEAARAVFEQARSELERQKQLREQNISAAAEFEAAEASFRATEAQLKEAKASVRSITAQAEEAKLGLERTSLFAPFDGVIALMNIRRGDHILGPSPDPQDALEEAGAAVVVIDDSEFEIVVQAPPFEAELFREGQRALVAHRGVDIAKAVRSGDVSGVLEGVVWSVSPSISLQRRSVSVKLRATGKRGLIRDGAYVTAWVATAEAEDALTIPYRAIQASGAESSVFVVNGADGVVERRTIELGLLGLEEAEVISGLAPGEVVVVEGQHHLGDGSKVAIIGQDTERLPSALSEARP